MKKIVGLLCFLMLSTALFADMTKAELQKMYLDYLKSRNITAEIDSDGDIQFSYEGVNFRNLTYWIVVDVNDQECFQIMKAGGYALDTAQKKGKAPLAASYATLESNVAKVSVNSKGDNIITYAETLIVSPQDFKNVFVRLMRDMDSALNTFLDHMN